jgi:serum/glucocorticoid-regulated kinase 2
MLKQEGIT